MKLLKNKKAWKKWCKEQGLQYQAPAPTEPVEYPCFAYCTVQSFGYEELRENYIFKAGLKEMLADFKKAAKN